MKSALKFAFGLSSGIAILIVALLLPNRLDPFSESLAASDITRAPTTHAWAEQITKPGLPNLHRVTDELYRGAQPTWEGFRELQALGVKTVINLRYFHDEREPVTNAGLMYEEIPMNTWHAEDEDVVRFLQLLANHDRAPFFIHCHHGSDRAGMLTAAYRIVIQDWSKDEAIEEMAQGGFGFHPMWQNLVEYIRDLDVEKLRQQSFPTPTQETVSFGTEKNSETQVGAVSNGK